MSSESDRGMLDRLGGAAGCRTLARSFYALVAGDAELKPLFPGKSLRCATEEFGDFLIQFFDGEGHPTNYRWWVSLRESHGRFKISARQRAAWLGHMRSALASVGVDASTQGAMEDFFTVASTYLVGGVQEGHVESAELANRWSQQLVMDRLIDDLRQGRDAEAIELASQCASRRSVNIGVLARMMDTGREALVHFVAQSVERNPDLATWRFNGRTLLHFAAGAGCLAVVRRLLALGVDPDTADSGGHAALFRVAGARGGDHGAEIVTELIRAGAQVDRCGGSSRATALHQAARFGNLPVAKALLAAGASGEAVDKNGFTPLDRARRCRRAEVVALLAPPSS